MEPRKLTKENLDKVRNMEGFPIGKDEDIIALSDAPYYTACPNPFIEEFIKENGTPYDEETDNYHREPYAADINEGKNDPIYNAHSYHTKVPYKAIIKYITHYTHEGDVIYDGFCGSGMTGVAAQMCGNADVLLSVLGDMTLAERSIGVRKAILGDLSPAASFISKCFNNKSDYNLFIKEAEGLLEDAKQKYCWMYETIPEKEVIANFLIKDIKGIINYIVWSDVFICPNCSSEIIFWEAALDTQTKKVSETFQCPHCKAMLKKSSCERAKTVIYDSVLKDNTVVAKQIPVLINYSINGKRYEKKPDESDIALIKKIEEMDIPSYVPVFPLPDGFNTDQPKKSHGAYYAHQFYTKRALAIISYFWKMANECESGHMIRLIITGIMQISSKMSRFRYDSRNTNNTAGGTLNGTLYFSSIQREGNVFQNYYRRYKAILSMVGAQKGFNGNNVMVQVASATDSGIPDCSIDYIFTDPPFGSNINYSELSTVWEAWLRVSTNIKQEAIINQTQRKGLKEYQELMTNCFADYYRVLKPNRWITVEFHNSKNAIWNAIQEGLQRAGFIIADVRTLNKKQGSFKQVTTASAVKQDLVISAYKPTDIFRRNFISAAGSEETAWSFVHQHLNNIPVVIKKGDNLEIIAERQAYLLFDRMVAYHIMQGLPVPIDAVQFYAGLEERFLKRDDMFFLSDQVNEYDNARIKNNVENTQLSFVVTNEKSAIEWLYFQLKEPQTYSELQPKFMQEVKSIDKYEAMPELSVLLDENFLQDEKSRWYIPDITKEADVAKLREKKLIKEFDSYLVSKGKLKLFRIEAIRAGFAKLWADKNYRLIVETAERLPEQIVQEDNKLLMYYDISLGRI